jgi:hypothetical protein
MRQSTDQFDARGDVLNGFDYGLQVWVTAGVILRCGHPGERCSCNARRFAGMTVPQAREVMTEPRCMDCGHIFAELPTDAHDCCETDSDDAPGVWYPLPRPSRRAVNPAAFQPIDMMKGCVPIALADLTGFDAREMYALAVAQFPEIPKRGMMSAECDRLVRQFYPNAESVYVGPYFKRDRLAKHLDAHRGRAMIASVRITGNSYHAIAIQADGTMSDNGEQRPRSVWSRRSLLWLYVL